MRKNFEIPSTNEVMELLAKGLSEVPLNNEELEIVGQYYHLEAPQEIYRYRPAELREIEALTKNKIWFSQISELNDPFECDFNIDMKKFAESIEEVKNLLPNMNSWQKQLLTQELSKLSDEACREFCNIFHNNAITCFSKKNDSLLMWGHYASGHRGICVEYNISELIRTNNKTVIPVNYSNKKPFLTGADSISVMRFFLQTIRTKHTDWIYEDEWRCIQDKEACGENWTAKGALLDSSPPTAIYVGCEADDIFVEQLTCVCKNILKIPLYKMVKSRDEYKLLPELIT